MFRFPHPDPRVRRCLRALLLAAVYLSLPMAIAQVHLGFYYPGDLASNLLVTGLWAAAILLLGAGLRLAGPGAACGVTLGVLHSSFLARVADAGLRDFHGQGFSRSFFYHFEWNALQIAIQEYPWVSIAVAVTMALFSWRWLALGWSGAKTPPARIIALGALMAGCGSAYLLMASSWGHLPLQGFTRELRAYFRTPPLTAYSAADQKALNRYGIRPIHRRSNAIQVEAPPQPLNLITIYLESVNFGFTRRGGSPHPGTTPHLDRLMAEHTVLENHLGAEGFTMAGLISSLCGMSPRLTKGNDSLAAEGDRYAELPCLSDILSHAGFRQVYLGGADKAFAGKAGFLDLHGYDEIYGWEDWIRRPAYRNNHSPWGIHDHDLFEEAFTMVQRLSQTPPFHLTILTLNTHLPGYHSAQCPPQGREAGQSDPFLSGLHCTDRALGRFVDRLAEEGTLAGSVVAIVGDHPLFDTPQTRELWGPQVDDPRVVGILLDPRQRLPRRVSFATATFDLAPTLLELLDVAHNGGFIQGRSILAERAQHQDFITRDHMVRQGRVTAVPTGAECADPGPRLSGRFPPSACEHRQALDLMDAYAAQFHGCQAATLCAMLGGGEIRASGSAPSAAVFLAAGDELQRFAQGGVPVDLQDRQGLVALVVNADGTVGQRRFFELCRDGRAGAELRGLLRSLGGGQALLLATRGKALECLDAAVRKELQRFGLALPLKGSRGGSLAFAGRRGGRPAETLYTYNAQGRPVSLKISDRDCRDLFGTQP